VRSEMKRKEMRKEGSYSAFSLSPPLTSHSSPLTPLV
jgi:hypothetical protein